ncbi:MAG: site-specific integrase [Nitrosopumilus sp.]|nr:site-specific integrase [Nitrosopumilus sp.]
MTSFLSKKKDNQSYEEKLATVPERTRQSKLYAIKVFEDFVCEKYNNRTVADIVEELQAIKKTQEQEAYDEALYGMLQDWINWNENRGLGNYTIRILFSNLRKYLFHIGIKTYEQDIKEILRFGKKTREERYPLSQDIYRQIVNGFARNPRLQALFLTLGSSGMRIGEAINLKKKDLDFTTKRIKVNVPATTKTRAGRTTYISKEAEDYLRPLVDKLETEDYIFARKNQRLLDPSVRKSLTRLLDRIDFTETYQSNNYRKITSHSFRAYFFTKAARKHGENYAHRIIGHGGYLMQYDRMTEDEKLEMYLELEPDLTIFDQTKNELEISRLRDKVEEINELKQEVQKLREVQAKSDKKILETMKRSNLFRDF